MIPLTPERVLGIVRLKRRQLLYGALAAASLSLFLGLLSPYIYRSEGSIQIAAGKTPDIMNYDNGDVLRAGNVVSSPRVLVRVAQTLLQKKKVASKLVVPHSIAIFDLEERLRIFAKGLFGNRIPAGEKEGADSPDILAGLMERHLRVTPDPSYRVLHVSYEGGTPEIAQEIAQSVIETAVDVIGSMEQQELQQQKVYLEKAISQQLSTIKETEEKMRVIVESYPQISIGQGDLRGAPLMAQRLIEKKELVRKLDGELKANGRFIETVRTLLRSSPDQKEVAPEVGAKLAEELAELEYKKVQYTQVSGYPETHPEVEKIKNRIAMLKKLLVGSKDDQRTLAALSESSINALMKQRQELAEKNHKLASERELASLSVREQETLFREMVKIAFDFESLSRSLTASVSVASDLYRDLQKTHIMMAGASGKAAILTPASLSVHSANLSVRKRVVFGFAVGACIALTLLLLIDLVTPKLIVETDLDALNVEKLGAFPLEPRTYARVASWLLARREKLGAGEKKLPGLALAVQPAATGLSWRTITREIMRSLVSRGVSVAVVDTDEENAAISGDWDGTGCHRQLIALDDVAQKLPHMVEVLAGSFDFVFLVIPENTHGMPFSEIFAEHAHGTLYLTRLGDTHLRGLTKEIRSLAGVATRKIALVFEPKQPPKWEASLISLARALARRLAGKHLARSR